jgi:hypothetical protein
MIDPLVVSRFQETAWSVPEHASVLSAFWAVERARRSSPAAHPEDVMSRALRTFDVR